MKVVYKKIKKNKNYFFSAKDLAIVESLKKDGVKITEDINFVFNEDSYFAELRETEILKERLQLLAAVEPYVGKYFSTEYIRKTILKQDEEQLDKINSQIEAEQEQMQLVQQAQMMQQQAQMMQQQEQQ